MASNIEIQRNTYYWIKQRKGPFFSIKNPNKNTVIFQDCLNERHWSFNMIFISFLNVIHVFQINLNMRNLKKSQYIPRRLLNF